MKLDYETIFEEMPCFLSVQDREFKIVRANARFRKHFGEFEGRYCYQVYKQRSERCEVCPVARTFRDGEKHESEEEITTLSGETLSVLVRSKPIYNEGGEIIAAMEMSTDITHIKNLQKLLRASQKRYHTLFDEVPCYISIQDQDLNIIEANKAFIEDFGRALGSRCYEAYKHRNTPCEPCPVQQTLADGISHTREEVVTSRHGNRKNVLVTTAPIRENGELTAVMEMSADITPIRDLEDRLTQLGLLIGSVSHSLKGLLNGLSGGMYLVNSGFKKDDKSRIKRGWATVQRNAERIKSMVSDILYYAKDRVPSWEAVSAEEIASDVVAMMESRAGELAAQLSLKVGADAGEFDGDPQALRALLANLVENSLDACRLSEFQEGHRVMVRVSGDAETVRYEVEDDGMGMDQETQEKAFSLFFSTKGTGTGLGLFISHKIARAHGGDIDLHSRVGEGTKFIVTLPRIRPNESESPDSPMTKGISIDA
ncbi:MAG: PAS domain-containing protein [Gemmatimonadetes bacterium]|nr:PAS domain-containing protein [Gemmatimonadota bacterium]NNM04411.1 PAS domain-containing protein [Gemmatimonadota bacterium]